jgi:hypothetical protein
MKLGWPIAQVGTKGDAANLGCDVKQRGRRQKPIQPAPSPASTMKQKRAQVHLSTCVKVNLTPFGSRSNPAASV